MRYSSRVNVDMDLNNLLGFKLISNSLAFMQAFYLNLGNQKKYIKNERISQLGIAAFGLVVFGAEALYVLSQV